MIEKPNVRFHDGQILSEEPLNKAMAAVDDCVDAANDAATKAETAETAATSAQSSASSAAESSAAIQAALEEIKSSGDIPAATITKVAEHTVELATLGRKQSELEETMSISKNILVSSNIERNVNGVDFSFSRGVLIGHGTATQVGGRLNRLTDLIELESGVYTFSKVKVNANLDVVMFVESEANTILATLQITNNSITFTLDNPTKVYIGCNVEVKTYDLEYHIQLEKGATATPFAPVGAKAKLIEIVEESEYGNSAIDKVARTHIKSIEETQETLVERVATMSSASLELSDISTIPNSVIATSTGNVVGGQNVKYSVSDYIDISLFKGKDVSIKSNLSGWFGAAIYDDTKTFIAGINTSVAPSGTQTFTYPIPVNAKYLRITLFDDLDITHYPVSCNIEVAKEVVNLSNTISSIKNSELDIFPFTKVGIIGDSLASGDVNTSSGAIDFKNFSWGKYLERKLGINVSLFTSGGASTRTWLTNTAWGLPVAQTDPCECYFIGLGVNDFANLGESYLGTIADVHVGNESANADTFYGNYSKIIAGLKAIQHRAKFFTFTMPYNAGTESRRSPFNNAIRSVCALYDSVVVLDLNVDSFYTGDLFNATWHKYHSTAIGYKVMADHIVSITNKYILSHIDEFKDVQFIGTNYDFLQ